MLNFLFFNFKPSVTILLTAFSVGAIIGIILQIYNDYKIRETEVEATEEQFATHQTRRISLLCDFDEAFELCIKSIEDLKKGRIELTDHKNGLIKAKTGMSFNSFGNIIEFNLKAITEILTEIEISTKPFVSITLIDYGKSIKIVKTLTDFFDAKNNEFSYRQLESKSIIPIEIYEQDSSSKTSVKN